MPSTTVFIVDDDPNIRSNLAQLLEMDNLKPVCFANPEEFLANCGPNPDGCLILDVRMPGMGGLQLQDELALREIHLPIIFLTGFGEIPMTVDAMRKGAVDFLTKPVDGAELLERVHSALNTNRLEKQDRAAKALSEALSLKFEARLLTLTPREREVLGLAITGMPNKTISNQLNLSVRTVEGYRVQIFLKLGVDSLIEVAQQAASANMPLADIGAQPQKE